MISSGFYVKKFYIQASKNLFPTGASFSQAQCSFSVETRITCLSLSAYTEHIWKCLDLKGAQQSHTNSVETTRPKNKEEKIIPNMLFFL